MATDPANEIDILGRAHCLVEAADFRERHPANADQRGRPQGPPEEPAYQNVEVRCPIGGFHVEPVSVGHDAKVHQLRAWPAELLVQGIEYILADSHVSVDE